MNVVCINMMLCMPMVFKKMQFFIFIHVSKSATFTLVTRVHRCTCCDPTVLVVAVLPCHHATT